MDDLKRVYISHPQKISIMGGTFDPIHYGHLVTAESVRHAFDVDMTLFIPTGRPPHKNNTQVTDPEDRYIMTMMATESNPSFFVSRIEIDRVGKTYTIDTINQLKESSPKGTEFCFITGADAYLQIFTWKNPELLLKSCTFIVATRPGYDRSLIEKEAAGRENLHFIEVPALSISSSDIRKRVQEHRPIKYLLPESVEQYIYKHNLYRSDNECPTSITHLGIRS